MGTVENNSRVLKQLHRGDLLQFSDDNSLHWAIYTVGGKRFVKASVKMDNFWMAAAGYTAHKNNNFDTQLRALPADKVVARAMSAVGSVNYSSVYSTCQSFAFWCRYNKKHVKRLSMECSLPEEGHLETPMELCHNVLKNPVEKDGMKSTELRSSSPRSRFSAEITNDKKYTGDVQPTALHMDNVVYQYKTVETIVNDDGWKKSVIVAIVVAAVLYAVVVNNDGWKKSVIVAIVVAAVLYAVVVRNVFYQTVIGSVKSILIFFMEYFRK